MTGDTPYNFLPKSQTVTRQGIHYSANDQGWRTHNNSGDTGSGTMFIGCSYTLGVGVALEDTWAHRVWQSHGTDCFWNLGMGGAGLDTMSRMFWHWAPLLKPERVYVLPLFEPRREFATDDGYHMISSTSKGEHDLRSMQKYFHWPMEQRIHGLRCRAWISHVASELRIPVTWVDDYSITTYDKGGADGMHTSADWHAKLASTLTELI